jgi:hypothetical protein
MYEYLDRSIGSLHDGSRFLIWSMRGWTQSMAERRCPPSALHGSFAKSDLADALPHFHLAMMALNRDGLDTMGFGAITCPHVSEAEAVLLALVRLIGTGRMAPAEATIALLVKAEAIPLFKRAIVAVVTLLLARFPLPDGVNGR